MLQFLDMAGVAVFALSGALEAGRKRMDLFGVLVVALVTAMGGGTLRDLLLSTGAGGAIFWMHDPRYIYAATLGGLAGFMMASPGRSVQRALLLADALGLAAASVIGAQRALSAGVPTPVVIIMSVMTGVAGGIGRDILCNEVPLVFRPDTKLYATAALLGGSVFLVLNRSGVGADFASTIAVCAAFALRLAALRWKLALPVKRL